MKNSCPSCSSSCAAVQWVICLLLFLASIASLVGVYRAHFATGGMVFGSTNSSLSILAFVVALTLWSKCMCRCLCSKE
ncbi:MAG TPA: hypothetical protein DEB30_00190 [Candidatus Peribacter riflensis]|nr:MAG: hypothetical protein PeribacterD2_0926 [Candidatus Peribacter riflensis]OGJ78522.1 MAG: hypothetical protein A2398_02680 [Candidatus Peribacteria bacterium RIFOXYB1_FULL_57_12]HBH19712.1 hypothetical protein [Candidatus Peribacter riflensis]HBU09208.1 hypothetical protein [Candidatus Peribacter riflensis]